MITNWFCYLPLVPGCFDTVAALDQYTGGKRRSPRRCCPGSRGGGHTPGCTARAADRWHIQMQAEEMASAGPGTTLLSEYPTTLWFCRKQHCRPRSTCCSVHKTWSCASRAQTVRMHAEMGTWRLKARQSWLPPACPPASSDCEEGLLHTGGRSTLVLCNREGWWQQDIVCRCYRWIFR